MKANCVYSKIYPRGSFNFFFVYSSLVDHIPSWISVSFHNVLPCLVSGDGAGDCNSILYSCDRKVIYSLS